RVYLGHAGAFDVSDDSPIVDDYFQIILEDKSCLIYHGLLLTTTLAFEFGQPTAGELDFFYSFSAFQWLQKDPDCQVGLVNLAASRLQSGNEVEVVGDGEPLKGMTGVVQSVERDVATVVIESTVLHQGVEIPLLSLRAVYQRGQYVKVVHGEHYGKIGFVVGIADEFLTVHDHRKSTSDAEKEAHAPVAQPLPFVKPHTQNNVYLGRNVRIIGAEIHKGYVGRIVKRMDNNNMMAEVELAGHLAFAKSDHLMIPLAHLVDMNDPTLTPLMQAYDSQRNQPDYDVPRHTLMPSATDPCQPPPATTPVWTGSSSTPAWNPSSQTPAHISEDQLPQPKSFSQNPYIVSALLPDDLRIEVIIHNTNQLPQWERGRFEGTRAIWPKKNNQDPGIAHVLISGNPYALPERNVKPNHPAGKGPVIVIDAQHPRYCQQMVVVQVRKGGICIV
ncbi:hypothetical protein H0H92_007134, partial [Tricholoma furcatifolium]